MLDETPVVEYDARSETAEFESLDEDREFFSDRDFASDEVEERSDEAAKRADEAAKRADEAGDADKTHEADEEGKGSASDSKASKDPR